MQKTPSRRKRERPIRPDALAYGVQEAADVLSISRRSVYDLIEKGRLKPIKLCGRTLITRAALEQLVVDTERDAESSMQRCGKERHG